MPPKHMDLSRLFRTITAATAAVLGVLMLVGGVGLGLALLTSSQPPLQVATAGMLIAVGAVNLLSGPLLVKGRPRALAASGLATAFLVVYLAGLGDFGEPFLFHSIYLLLLAGLAYQQQSIRAGV